MCRYAGWKYSVCDLQLNSDGKEFIMSHSVGHKARMLVLALMLLTTMGIFVAINTPHAHAAQAHQTRQSHQTQALHGATQFPASRTYACFLQGPQNPTTPACQAAVASGGTQPLYEWFAVRRSDGAGRTSGFIPDGELCSAGNPEFAAYDAPRAD